MKIWAACLTQRVVIVTVDWLSFFLRELHFKICANMYHVNQKEDILLVPGPRSPIVDSFSKLFHCRKGAYT